MTVDDEWLSMNPDGSAKYNFNTEAGRCQFFEMRCTQFPWVAHRWIARVLFGVLDAAWVFHRRKLSDDMQALRKIVLEVIFRRFVYCCDIAWTKMIDQDLTKPAKFLDLANSADVCCLRLHFASAFANLSVDQSYVELY
jgi:hypothetical protein